METLFVTASPVSTFNWFNLGVPLAIFFLSILLLIAILSVYDRYRKKTISPTK